jgi:hypothetical protein
MIEDFYIAFLYRDGGVALDESVFLRAVFPQLKCDDVADMRQRILAFGVNVLELPHPHLFFHAPGGQVLPLVGINKDLSEYEETDHGEESVGVGWEQIAAIARRGTGRHHLRLDAD